MSTCDLAVIGAGPAGMAAAVRAAGLGLTVTVVDEQLAPGGQVFRGIEQAGSDPALDSEYAGTGLALVAEFRRTPGIDYRPGTTVWHVAPDVGRVSVTAKAGPEEIDAARILIAVGAQERPMPIPGWALPGVMSAGAAQIMLKTAGARPAGRTVLAGQGPLMWLIARQLLAAGVPDLTLLQTTPRSAALRAAPAGGLWRGRRQLHKGLAYRRAALRAGLRLESGVAGVRAEGDGRLERIVWDGGSLPADTVLLHEGVVPSTHITRALGLEHRWNEAQASWEPVLDSWGASSHSRIAVAGDCGGVGGWEAAVAAGGLAALDAAVRLGRLDAAARGGQAAGLLRTHVDAVALRPFLDRMYRPAPSILAPPADDTLVCRCEEVTAGQIRAAARLGARGPNQVKAFVRAGMGPCQGRMCGSVTAALVAEVWGIPVQETGALRPRAPFKPLTVGDLAGVPRAERAA